MSQFGSPRRNSGSGSGSATSPLKTIVFDTSRQAEEIEAEEAQVTAELIADVQDTAAEVRGAQQAVVQQAASRRIRDLTVLQDRDRVSDAEADVIMGLVLNLFEPRIPADARRYAEDALKKVLGNLGSSELAVPAGGRPINIILGIDDVSETFFLNPLAMKKIFDERSVTRRQWLRAYSNFYLQMLNVKNINRTAVMSCILSRYATNLALREEIELSTQIYLDQMRDNADHYQQQRKNNRSTSSRVQT